LASAESRDETSDFALVARIRSGDAKAMAQLYDRYSGIVYSIAMRVLADAAAAEDVLQEVFLHLWRMPGAFDDTRGSLPAWLVVLARSRAIDAHRKRRPQVDIDDVVVAVDADLADSADREKFAGRIRSVLAQMPETQRRALEMAYFAGMTHSEIALKTGEPLGTIKTRIRSGVLCLREALGA
jgi:RNA polymerase sigma-70 factor (ECF subfamily)